DRGALRVRFGPFRLRWVFEHRDYIEGRQFRDVQLSGPFRRWEHTHLFTPEGPGVCILEDRLTTNYRLEHSGFFWPAGLFTGNSRSCSPTATASLPKPRSPATSRIPRRLIEFQNEQ